MPCDTHAHVYLAAEKNFGVAIYSDYVHLCYDVFYDVSRCAITISHR